MPKSVPGRAGFAAAAAWLASAASAQEVVRYGIEGSDFPISESVAVPPGAETVFVSGAVPRAIVEGGDRTDTATFGDMEAQTVSVLEAIEARLERLGLGMGDVVMMRAYLVGEGQDDLMDFAGFMRGYTQFFGTADQPNLPARSALQVAGLAAPGWLVEIEVVAARVPCGATCTPFRGTEGAPIVEMEGEIDR